MTTERAPYIMDSSLQRIVDAAQILHKPLLLKGEPGTGKTSLAYALADRLGLPILTWQVKSTTRAQDGLYTYDTVQRLNDSRFGDGDVSDIRKYIKYGPLGQSFQSEAGCILLIDEIDKADVEFPNDLLHELDAMDFDVVETGDHIEATIRPIVIITSNAERELPDAFLRRCLFHFIEFPTVDSMQEIVNAHFPGLPKTLLERALTMFYQLRDVTGVRKKPSTSELIDWIRVLLAEGTQEDAISVANDIGILFKRDTDADKVSRFLAQRNL